MANFDDAGSIQAPLPGISRAYLVTPSSAEAEVQQVRFVQLAAEAGVEQIVKLSQFAAAEGSPVRFLRDHAAVERKIHELGIGDTFLRPNLDFQGFLAFQALIAKEGRFFAPIGEARVNAVDVRDIVAVAAIALTEPGYLGQTYTITGLAAISHAEVAQAISEAIGRNVTFWDVLPESFAAALRNFGVPPWQVDGLLEDYAHYARGEAAAVSPTDRELTRVEPREFAQFARDYATLFRSQSAGQSS